MADSGAKPIYVLCGSDAFLRAECRKRIISTIIGQADPQTAVTTFETTAELADVLDELRTVPFLAPRRAVVIPDADDFLSAHREAIERYLASPSSVSSLILGISSWPNKTARLQKLVAKIGQVIDCSAPGPKELLNRLNAGAAKCGKKLAPDAAELLLEWCGQDLAALYGELEKLSLYVGEREGITADDVATLVTATAGPGAFELTNAIAAGDAPAALKALAGSLTGRGEEFKALGMVAWHLRKALHVQQLIKAGADARQACKSAGVFYRQDEFLRTLSRRPIKALQDDFRKVLAADLAMKTGAEALATMQELVVKLCW